MTELDEHACHDCGVQPGEPHEDGCDTARCLQTGFQRLSCFEDHDCGEEVWTGTWPGEMECTEFGWYSYFTPGTGWVRCGKDHPDAGPDLNRLHGGEAHWDRDRKRWVLRDAAAGHDNHAPDGAEA